MMLELIIIPIAVGLIIQALKLIIDGIPNNFTWQHLMIDYGGMPSSHIGFVSALATLVGIQEGFNSAAFAISVALLIIVIRDAVGFRRQIGQNSAFTNMIGKEVFKKKKVDYLYEKTGHTLPEVFAGFLLGSALAIFLYQLWIFWL